MKKSICQYKTGFFPVLFILLAMGYWQQGTAQDEPTFYHIDDYASVKKADVHVHIRTHRPSFAEKARKDNFQLVNVAVDGAGSWDAIRSQWKYIQMQKASWPKTYQMVTACSVEDFHSPDWESKTIAWLDSCFEQGATGVKFWKNIGMVLQDQDSSMVMLDDARFDAVFNHIIDADKIVMGHLGEPLNCWLPLEEMTTNNDRSYFTNNPHYHMYKHPELPSYQDQMDARNRRLDRHADMKFMGAHMASIEWNVDTLAAWFETYPTATIDLAARMGQVFYQTIHDREKVRDFFIKYQDRIMYATDLGDQGTNTAEELASALEEVWMRDWKYFVTDEAMESDLVNESFMGIKLPKDIVDKIFYQTAARWFGFN